MRVENDGVGVNDELGYKKSDTIYDDHHGDDDDHDGQDENYKKDNDILDDQNDEGEKEERTNY